MSMQTMQRIEINGVQLEICDRGAGEPVVFVHGAMTDECAAVVQEPALTKQFRVIDYHRRGFGRSECPEMPVSIAQQVLDLKAILRHLGVERAHFVGQSYGGVIILQLALDAPEIVQSLALLEPALPHVLFNSEAFMSLMVGASALYQAGDKAGAIDMFGQGVAGADYRTVFDRTLPPGWFERWVAASDTIFLDTALQAWSFTREDAERITQPVLNVVGADSAPYFWEINETVQSWLPQAENVVLPNSPHAMLQIQPRAIAEQLAGFFTRHPMQDASLIASGR
jgi:pimeloyl-ACP methyl ester carboxylesterase